MAAKVRHVAGTALVLHCDGMECSMEVSLDLDAVLHGASPLPGVRGSLPSGLLPAVLGVGDPTVDTARVALSDWWTTMSAGMADDIDALHQLVAAAANAQAALDRRAAADMNNAGDPMAPFRVK